MTSELDVIQIKTYLKTMIINNVNYFLENIYNYSSSNKIIIQCFDATKIYNEKHIYYSIIKAYKSFNEKSNVSNDVGLEIMRYSSGQRKINKSYVMGVHEGINHILFLVIGVIKNKNINIFDEDNLYDWKNHNKKYTDLEFIKSQFEITEQEINIVQGNISDLIIERICLIDIIR